MTYPQASTVEVWEWINNFFPNFTGHWLFIHAGIKVTPHLKKGTQNIMDCEIRCVPSHAHKLYLYVFISAKKNCMHLYDILSVCYRYSDTLVLKANSVYIYVSLNAYWFNYMCIYVYKDLLEKQVSRTGTSNYIPQILWDVITCPRPWYLLVAHRSPYRQLLSSSLACLDIP